MKTEILNRLLQDQKAKRQVALLTHLETGAQSLVYPDETHGDLAVDAALQTVTLDAFRDDRSHIQATPNGDVFIQVFNPSLRMVVVGAVHIAQPLARMAAMSGWDVTIVDPRGSFASSDRFPGVHLINEWPDEALTELDLDRRTAVVTLTHDPKIDDPALQVAIRSAAFYIGSLGSRKTHAARLKRLKDADFTDDEMARIHGPVGLSLGAVSPSEIAVSILAQVIQSLHQKEADEAA
ncbi:MAG: XdhC family protein [Rhodospirillales bacterium]|nr:XdhC family protein [Rhodospirillales bacterium]